MKKLKVTVDGKVYDVVVEALESPASPASETAAASAPSGGSEVPSPLAGKVVELQVAVGDQVSEGDTLLMLEAMKMNTLVSSPVSGLVQSINVAAGDTVEEGQSLLSLA